VSIFWYLHTPVKGEEREKSFQRDLACLLLVVKVFGKIFASSCHLCAGLVRTTTVKKKPNTLLCGLTCDEELSGIADLLIDPSETPQPDYMNPAVQARIAARLGVDP